MAAHRDLRSFIAALQSQGQLVEIHAEVDPDLELAEIHRRVIAASGPALLFRRVRGSAHSVVTNLYGTTERVRTALGDRPEELIRRVASIPHELLPPSPRKLWRERGLLWSLAKVGLKRGARGSVLKARHPSPDLTRLPMTKSWSEDGGAFLTMGFAYTEHPDTGVHNLGLYRMQRHDRDTLGMHWQIGKGGGFHHAAAEAKGQALPVNVFLGGPPAVLLGALAPLPENVPELLLSSLALGQRLRLAKNPAGPLPLLADAEFVLVGEVPARERRDEGPFGDHYGYYSLRHPFPFARIRAVFHRPDAILPATVVGKPRQEDFFLGDYLQDLLSPLFPVVMPGVRDLWSYGETGYHALSAAVVHERYRREAMASAFRILGEGQLSLTKFLLLTDRSVNLRDFKQVLVHVLERADFESDLYVFANLSMDTLDYAGPRLNEGSKGVLLGLGDPVRDLPSGFSGPVPPPIEKALTFAPGCLVLQVGQGFGEDPKSLCQLEAFRNWPLLVLVDDAEQAVRSTTNFLWTAFTRFDPARDLHARGRDWVGTHGTFHPPVLLDARMKAHYPGELFCDPATAATVSRRWKEYFPQGGVEMGDSDRGHLD